MNPNEHAGYHVIYGCDPGDCDKNSCTCKLKEGTEVPSLPKNNESNNRVNHSR